jgi:hypothetical protein
MGGHLATTLYGVERLLICDSEEPSSASPDDICLKMAMKAADMRRETEEDKKVHLLEVVEEIERILDPTAMSHLGWGPVELLAYAQGCHTIAVVCGISSAPVEDVHNRFYRAYGEVCRKYRQT